MTRVFNLYPGENQQRSNSGFPVVHGLQHRENLQPLTKEQICFEIDMCIGCDRCMLACPIPISTRINIADLNMATFSNGIPPNIAQFTEECVMCGSCVPVCPVDNHRDLLMLSLKQRLGTSWNGPVDISRVQRIMPIGWNLPLLLSYLRQQALFSNPQLIPDNYLLHLVAASKIVRLEQGDVLVREGEFCRDIYFILDGQFELSAIGPLDQRLTTAILRRGEYVGEYGMLTGQPQPATVCSQTASIALMVPEQIMQRLMELVPAVRDYFEQLSNARSIITILRRMDLFQGVSKTDIQLIARNIQIRSYEREERLFCENGPGQPAYESIHILLEGFVKVARHTAAGKGHHESNQRIIAYRQHGDYFMGGLDMLGGRQAVTVTAITHTRVAEIPREIIQAAFRRYPEIAQRFQMRLQQYHEDVNAAQTGVFAAVVPPGAAQGSTSNPLSHAEARAGLHALVSDGVVEGTEVLVIDLDKCVHCSECEEACARRHGHSRMNRKGIVVGNISIATACRHCQDPVCMLCSRAGIARLPGGEVYITESCIGCGICAERCPYDNISIVTLAEQDDEEESPSTWQRFSNVFKKGIGREAGRKILPMANNEYIPKPLDTQKPVDAYGQMLKKVAVKCDLCAGYENQACIQACPTGAAFRVQPSRFFGSTEEILRRRAR